MTDIVIALNYYSPYVSGLTNVARDVAEGLAARGHSITVVTSQHDPELAREETIAGVRVLRCPVRLRFGKGVISPSFLPTVVREAKRARVVNLHLPMLEAGVLAVAVRRFSRAALVPTYHCDVALPPSVVNTVQRKVIDVSSRIAARQSHSIVVTSDDYADASRISSALGRGRIVIPPGCHRRDGGAPTYRETEGLHVGFLGRLVEEKGIEYLVEGFSRLRDPDARLLIGGDFAKIAGGSVVDRVRAAIGEDDRIRVMGFVPDERMADFYSSLDVFALTSINSFEAFGIVQVEAMIAGSPAIASDLPGVRQPVAETGFGIVVPPRDSMAITAALQRLRDETFDTSAGSALADRLYGLPGVLDRYEELFERLGSAQLKK